jgi:hypothetical protein
VAVNKNQNGENVMQGVFINGRRPKSKAEIKRAVAVLNEPVPHPLSLGAVLASKHPRPRVEIEATSVFGNEFGGAVQSLPTGTKVHFAGPNPYTQRNFYGTIEWKGDKLKVS